MHPFHEHRQTKKEHSRVGKITKGYASGGAVNRTEDDRKVRKMSASQEREVDPEGGVSPHRMDRPKRRKGGKVKRDNGGGVQSNDDASFQRVNQAANRQGQSASSGMRANPNASYDPRTGKVSGFAKGGKVKSKGNSRTIVNVITGGHPAGGAVPAMPIQPPAPGIAGAALPPPPMGAKPPMPMPPPGGPPPMPLRAKGGRIHKAGGGASGDGPTYIPGDTLGNQNARAMNKHSERGHGIIELPGGPQPSIKDFVAGDRNNGGKVNRAKGGRVNQGSPVYEAGKRAGTQVSHDNGKSDLPDMHRKRVVTFATGGGVVSFKAGGRVESPQGVAKATRLPGGASGGEARLVKAHRAERKG